MLPKSKEATAWNQYWGKGKESRAEGGTDDKVQVVSNS